MSSKKSVLFMMSCGLSFFIMDYYFLFSELNSIDFQRVFIDSFLICTMLLLLICAFYLACTVPFKKENKRISCLNKALSLYSYLICVAVAILLICVAFQYRLVTLYPHWVVTGNALLFPFVLMVSTLIVELYGLRGNLILTFILVGVQLFFDSVLMLSALLPSPSFFDLTPFYDYVLPRRILTGGINTLIIFLSNGYILDKLSRVPGLKHRVVRIFLANFASATLTCLISYSLMLTGVYTYEQIINLALNAWIFKNGLSIITLPLIIWIYTMLIKHLNAEQPSNKIRYNQEKNPGLSMANKING